MEERQKTAHVLRRFGLGAGRHELAKYEKLGWRKTLEALVRGPAQPHPLSPWRAFVMEDGMIEPYAYRLGGWWALCLAVAGDPGRHKAAVFWHDHFALDAEKVGEGPMMLGYVETLLGLGRGRFRDLLHAVCKQGAMALYLDAVTSNRLHPNENFARELLELFTIGEGNYTERDVAEAARACTGWTMHYLGSYTDYDYTKLVQAAIRQKLGVSNFAYVPAIHDPGEKTILGQTRRWTGDELLDMLADRPETALHLCRKLWEFYAYEDPEPSAVERAASVWRRSKGDIAETLLAIGTAPEFWSARCVRKLPKSPLDWTVGILRGCGVGDVMAGFLEPEKGDFDPPKKELRDGGGGIHYLMALQGMSLLFPPDVGGWQWGLGWLNASATLARVRHTDILLDYGQPIGLLMLARLRESGDLESPERIARGVADLLDAELDADELALVAEAVEKAGGPAAAKDEKSGTHVVAQAARTVFLSPGYQLG